MPAISDSAQWLMLHDLLRSVDPDQPCAVSLRICGHLTDAELLRLTAVSRAMFRGISIDAMWMLRCAAYRVFPTRAFEAAAQVRGALRRVLATRPRAAPRPFDNGLVNGVARTCWHRQSWSRYRQALDLFGGGASHWSVQCICCRRGDQGRSADQGFLGTGCSVPSPASANACGIRRVCLADFAFPPDTNSPSRSQGLAICDQRTGAAASSQGFVFSAGQERAATSHYPRCAAI